MVELGHLREFMHKQAEEDRNRKWVQVEGDDLDDALRQAAIELSLEVRDIEYEVRDLGRKGTFGFGKKNVQIVAYPRLATADEIVDEDSFDLGFESEEEIADRDGEAIVRFFPEGIFLKVEAPQGDGGRATVKDVESVLQERGIREYDRRTAQRALKRMEGSYVKIGDFGYNPAQDAVITVDITDFDMKAYMIVKPPGTGGADPNFDGMIGFLKNNNVVYGIKEDQVEEFVDHPVYHQAVLVAEGSNPANGADARIVYNFETNRKKMKLKEKNGRVDFKESNLIQNVVEGQAIAKKIAAEEGTPGRTVTGKYLPAKDGADVKIQIGKNVKLIDDGHTAVATINGQVVMVNDKLNVEPVYVVDGDVNLKNGGNVTFLGTVMVKGSVEDGYKVKAAGNIEIMGNVGKSELDAEGDIIVHQGIAGKSEGSIRAGKGVWAKFIENVHIESGELVVASDGIINSRVEANQRIICQGKRATIVGGHLRAAEEIHARTLGSVAGSETVLEVGFDPKSKEQLVNINSRLEEIAQELEKLEQNISSIEKLRKKKEGELPEEKQKTLQESNEKRDELLEEQEEKKSEKQEIEEYLSSLKVKGRVSASDRVFSGVKVIIKDATLDIKNDYKAITFINENNIVKTTKYVELEEDYTKRNDATTN